MYWRIKKWRTGALLTVRPNHQLESRSIIACSHNGLPTVAFWNKFSGETVLHPTPVTRIPIAALLRCTSEHWRVHLRQSHYRRSENPGFPFSPRKIFELVGCSAKGSNSVFFEWEGCSQTLLDKIVPVFLWEGLPCPVVCSREVLRLLLRCCCNTWRRVFQMENCWLLWTLFGLGCYSRIGTLSFSEFLPEVLTSNVLHVTSGPFSV